MTDYRKLHEEAIVIDGTCPLARDVAYLPWWQEGGATAIAPTVGGFEGPAGTLKELGRWHRLFAERDDLVLVRHASDIEAVKAAGKLGLILHFQGTEPLADCVDLVDAYKALGVGIIQLAYNVKNRVGDGASERTDCGLSYFGRELIARLDDARVVVDCAHTGYRTTMEAIEASTRPVIVSHANAKAVKDSRRNLTDDQITAIADNGGLVGVVGFLGFVSDDPHPTLDQLIDHIDHLVNVGGIDHVALAIDYYHGMHGVTGLEEARRAYDGFIESGRWRPEDYPPPPHKFPQGIDTPQSLPNMTKRLLERGYAEDAVRKILGLNWVRVLREVWGS